MINAYPPCSKKYFKNADQVKIIPNAVPVQIVNENDVDYIQIYFPKPWLIIGAIVNPIQASPPSVSEQLTAWPFSYLNYKPVGNPQCYTFSSVFLDCAFATTIKEEDKDLYPFQYYGPGQQAIDYRGYFSDGLNAQTLNVQQYFYNELIQPESFVSEFWRINNAADAATLLARFFDLVKTLPGLSDLNKWGAPGIYRWPLNVIKQLTWQPRQDFYTFQNL